MWWCRSASAGDGREGGRASLSLVFFFLLSCEAMIQRHPFYMCLTASLYRSLGMLTATAMCVDCLVCAWALRPLPLRVGKGRTATWPSSCRFVTSRPCFSLSRTRTVMAENDRYRSASSALGAHRGGGCVVSRRNPPQAISACSCAPLPTPKVRSLRACSEGGGVRK